MAPTGEHLRLKSQGVFFACPSEGAIDWKPKDTVVWEVFDAFAVQLH